MPHKAKDWAKIATVIVSIAGLIAMVMVACWKRGGEVADNRTADAISTEARFVRIEGLVAAERESRIEHERVSRDAHAGTTQEVHELRQDLVSARIDARAAREAAERAESAAHDTRSLLIEVLKMLGVAPSQPQSKGGQSTP